MQTLLSFVHHFLLVAAGAVLGGSELVHLGDALLELLVLALFVCVALVLRQVLVAVAVERSEQGRKQL